MRSASTPILRQALAKKAKEDVVAFAKAKVWDLPAELSIPCCASVVEHFETTHPLKMSRTDRERLTA